MEIKKGLFSYLLIFILSVAIVGAVTQISSNYISVDELRNGGSPVKIAGINISENSFYHMESVNRSLNFIIQNTNSGTNATAVISATNDVGGSMSIGIGSSKFVLGEDSFSNATALFSRSRGMMVFANLYKESFEWYNNPSDDGDSMNIEKLMTLDGDGLNVSTLSATQYLPTGASQSQYFNFYKDTSGGTRTNFNFSTDKLRFIGGLGGDTKLTLAENPNNEKVLRLSRSGAGDNELFVVSEAGDDLASYFTRSLVVGGNSPNMTSSYLNLDFRTSVTGADLGIEDDIEILGSGYIGENLTVTGNITSNNMFMPQYIFAHNNETMTLASANVWANLTFDQEVAGIKEGIGHTFNDDTNHTFTINEDGIYDIDYNFDVIDASVSASDIDVAARVVYSNGTEITGSVFETDIIKQNIENELSHSLLVRLIEGDVIVFQFTADDVDVEISTHGTFGSHPESATVRIEKVANLP